MIVNLKSKTDLSGFYVVYYGSTNLEKPGNYGLSHLMEHLICKSFDHLQEDFDKDGIEFNAYTSSNEIVFHWTGLDERLNKWKGEIMKLLSKFEITKEQFEMERNIVLEEYSDYFNEQSNNHFLNLFRKKFNDYGAIGLGEDLKSLKYIDIINFWELQFMNPSKIINVSKNSPFTDKTVNFSEDIKYNEFKYGDYDAELELSNDFKDKSSLIMTSKVISDDYAYVNFINYMLSLGLKSPLYEEVREKNGLVYYISMYQMRKGNSGINTISTSTSNKNVDKVLSQIKLVLSNPDKYLTKERFDVVKDYFSVRKEINDINRYNNINPWISPEEWNIYEILDKVNMSKIKEVYSKYFNFEDFYISNDRTEFK